MKKSLLVGVVVALGLIITGQDKAININPDVIPHEVLNAKIAPPKTTILSGENRTVTAQNIDTPEKYIASRGGEIKVLATLEVEATAYTNDELTKAETNTTTFQTVATDWSIIPGGSMFYIDGFGSKIFIAEDTGGAIKGNIIDIYNSDRNWCIQWGRRQVKIQIIHWGDSNVNKIKQIKKSQEK